MDNIERIRLSESMAQPNATAPVVKSFSQSSRDKRCLEVWFDREVTDDDRAWLLEAINEKALRDRASTAAKKCEVKLAGENWHVIRDGEVISEHALHRDAARAARAADCLREADRTQFDCCDLAAPEPCLDCPCSAAPSPS